MREQRGPGGSLTHRNRDRHTRRPSRDAHADTPTNAGSHRFTDADRRASRDDDRPASGTPTPARTPESTPAAVTVAGPLLVLSERVRAEQEADEREIEVRRIVVYDVGAERYWTPFEYRNVRVGSVGLSAVQPAGRTSSSTAPTATC